MQCNLDALQCLFVDCLRVLSSARFTLPKYGAHRAKIQIFEFCRKFMQQKSG